MLLGDLQGLLEAVDGLRPVALLGIAHSHIVMDSGNGAGAVQLLKHGEAVPVVDGGLVEVPPGS